MTSHDIDMSRAVWQKSIRSGGNGGQCVEIARNLPGIVAVRDSKNPNGTKLLLESDEWRAFVRGVKTGTYDL